MYQINLIRGKKGSPLEHIADNAGTQYGSATSTAFHNLLSHPCNSKSRILATCMAQLKFSFSISSSLSSGGANSSSSSSSESSLAKRRSWQEIKIHHTWIQIVRIKEIIVTMNLILCRLTCCMMLFCNFSFGASEEPSFNSRIATVAMFFASSSPLWGLPSKDRPMTGRKASDTYSLDVCP